jgi:hypothetical protein
MTGISLCLPIIRKIYFFPQSSTLCDRQAEPQPGGVIFCIGELPAYYRHALVNPSANLAEPSSFLVGRLEVKSRSSSVASVAQRL